MLKNIIYSAAVLVFVLFIIYMRFTGPVPATVKVDSTESRPNSEPDSLTPVTQVPVLLPDTAGRKTAAAPVEQNDSTEVDGQTERDVIPGEYLLGFYDDADMRRFIKFARAEGIDINGQIPGLKMVRAKFRDADHFKRLQSKFPVPVESSPNYSIMSPVARGKNPIEPQDGYMNFENMSLKWLGVPGNNESWGRGVTVAVLDSGVLPHKVLGDRKIREISVVEDRQGGKENGHGTAVASLIGGTSEAVPGIAPGADILSVKILSDAGTGDILSLAQGIIAAVDSGANVINMCVGTSGDSFAMQKAVNYAKEKGVVLVASAGNDAVEGVLYPARYDGVIAVSSVDGAGRHLYFANRGPEIDIAAPGIGIVSAWTGNDLVSFSGTSASVPFVSGAIAGLMSENPDMEPDQIIDLLYSYSNDGGMPGRDNEFGNGTMNIRRVLERDTPGIYDVAAGDIMLKTEDGNVRLFINAQNRGTENIYGLDLNLAVNGVERTYSFLDVDVGETIKQEYFLGTLNELESGDVKVSVSASIRGESDRFMGDNTKEGVLHLEK